jgi:hypothetical protein
MEEMDNFGLKWTERDRVELVILPGHVSSCCGWIVSYLWGHLKETRIHIMKTDCLHTFMSCSSALPSARQKSVFAYPKQRATVLYSVHLYNTYQSSNDTTTSSSSPIPVHLNDMATTNDTFSSWLWTEKTKYGQYFCPRKNGPVWREVSYFQLFNHFLKTGNKVQKLSNFFQQQKCLKMRECSLH